jgi:hypothetical protein
MAFVVYEAMVWQAFRAHDQLLCKLLSQRSATVGMRLNRAPLLHLLLVSQSNFILYLILKTISGTRTLHGSISTCSGCVEH